MPEVARNYQREDFSDLLAQMQQSAAEAEKKPREPKKADQPGVLHCRVRRWEVKQFLKAAAKPKERSIQAADEGYIAVCEKIHAPDPRVSAGIR